MAAPPPARAAARARRGRRGAREGLAARLTARLLQEVEKHFEATPGAAEWLQNVSVHVEQPLAPHADDAPSAAGGPARRGRGARGADGAAARPNVWLYFPTYHGAHPSLHGCCNCIQYTLSP